MTVRVHDPRVYSRILREGSVGLGESYADGWWDTDDLSGFLRLAHRSLARTHTARDRVHRWLRPVVDPVARRRRADKDRDAAQRQRPLRPRQRVLPADPRRNDDVLVRRVRTADGFAGRGVACTSSIVWPTSSQLAPGDRVLEIGTGWGGFAVHAATHYGCHVTTTTISQRQYEFAQRRVANAGLEDRVTVLADDYRDLGGTFDKIIAIEMIEAVDWREYDTFFAHCRRLLDDAGALAMQAIVVPDESFDRIKLHTDFIKTAIFPGGCLPSVGALTAAADSNGFSLAHLDDIGLHYGETLRRWRRNLTDARDDSTARPRRAIRAALGVLLLLLRGRVRRALRPRRAVARTRRRRGARRRCAPPPSPRPFTTVGGAELVRT